MALAIRQGFAVTNQKESNHLLDYLILITPTRHHPHDEADNFYQIINEMM
jgi:hypothetical protein